MAEKEGITARLVATARRIGSFVACVARRSIGDDIVDMAASLSYTTLLALVPMLAIALAVLAAFPVFDDARNRLRSAIFEILPPEQAAQAAMRFQEFLDNAANLTAVGVIGLAVTALLLLSAINAALNRVWRITRQRPLASRFLVYWALLTLGPLLVGASLTVSSYAFALAQDAASQVIGNDFVAVYRVISIVLATIGLSLVFFLVPNRTVLLRDAFAGGLTAALLLETLKFLFGLYLRHFPSYTLLYGALAAIPIFLFWMYMAWMIVLLGAEIAAALPEWRVTRRRDSGSERVVIRLVLALSVLERLREAHAAGRTLRRGRLLHSLPATPAEFDDCLSRLQKAKLVQRNEGGGLLLGRDLGRVDFDTLLQVLDLRLHASVAWPEPARQVVEAMDAMLRPLGGRSLAELLEDPDLPGKVERLARPSPSAAD